MNPTDDEVAVTDVEPGHRELSAPGRLLAFLIRSATKPSARVRRWNFGKNRLRKAGGKLARIIHHKGHKAAQRSIHEEGEAGSVQFRDVISDANCIARTIDKTLHLLVIIVAFVVSYE
jgi:hypothetical protein